MNTQHELEAFVMNGYKDYLPHMSIDPVIVGYHAQQLKVLLLHWKGMDGWGLPV